MVRTSDMHAVVALAASSSLFAKRKGKSFHVGSKALQCHGNSGKILADTIVQLTGDPSPLFVLTSQ